jgi:UDP-3-O-[3-hydroxymyristoyl] glucosamine N-acyltransferase
MPKTAGELALYLKGELVGDPSVVIRSVASLDSASEGDLVYADSEKTLPQALASPASVVIVGTEVFVRGKTFIRVSQPRLAFARTLAWLAPEPPVVAGRHPSAVIHPTATLGENVAVGPGVVIEEHARIGRNCQIGAGCYVGASVEIGEGAVLFPRVAVYRHARIGARVRIHSGAVIGSDGFGYVPTEGGWEKFPQRGVVVIEDDVEVGANTTIDRGALDETWIGAGTKLDNLVHVGHNVRIGRHCIVEAQTGISGSCTIGDRVILGGQVGLGDHVRVEDGAILAGQCGVPSYKVIRRGQTVWGTPARPLEDFKRTYPYVARLPQLAERLAALERKLGNK